MQSEITALKMRVEKLSALKDMVMEISRIRNVEDLFWYVAIETTHLLQAQDCAVLLKDSSSDALTIRTSKSRNTGVRIPADATSILISVYKTLKPRLTDSAQTEPDFNAAFGAQTGLLPDTLLATPIVLHQRAIGVIEVINRVDGVFANEDLEILQTISTHVAAAIENSWLNESSQRRLDELSTLVEISQAISTSLDNETLFENLAHKLIETAGVDEFCISEWDRNGDRLLTIIDYMNSENPGPDPAGTPYLLSEYPHTRKILENRTTQIVRIDDPDADPAETHLLRVYSRAAVIMIPLVVRNASIGIMEIYLRKGDPVIENRVHLFQSIASQIAAALENSRLYETTRRHALELEKRVTDRMLELERLYKQQAALAESEREHRKLAETLREAGAIVAANLELDRAISEILTQLARVVPHDSASVQLLDNGELVIVGGGGWIEYKDMLGFRFAIPGPNPNTVVVQHRKPLILNQEELLKYNEFQKATHGAIHSWLGVPLITKGTVIGMLTLDSVAPAYFTDQHAGLVSAFADQVAVAIEQAILFEKTQAALGERDALRAIVAEISDELDLSRLLNAVLVRACELLNSGSAELALYREETETVEIVAAHNMGGDFIGVHLELGRGAIGYTAQTREPQLIDDYHAWEHALSRYQENPWRAVMTTTLTYQQRLIGVIAMADKRAERQFTTSDLELLNMFAHQVAIAIENAQLFQKVQLLATTDELTGLPNRRELFRLGEEMRHIALVDGTPLSAVMFDLDLFKRINDSFGHSIGDQVLQGLSQICEQRIRTDDLLGRYGGEEFTLLLPKTTFEEGCEIADRLRKAIETQPIQTDRGEFQITVSFGVAFLSPRHANLATLLDEADLAMYQAKNRGRNQVVGICDPPGQAPAQ